MVDVDALHADMRAALRERGESALSPPERAYLVAYM